MINAVAPAIAVERTNQLDRSGAGKRSNSMRVASIENILTAATLVTAIVVVLWAIKIVYGA